MAGLALNWELSCNYGQVSADPSDRPRLTPPEIGPFGAGSGSRCPGIPDSSEQRHPRGDGQVMARDFDAVEWRAPGDPRSI